MKVHRQHSLALLSLAACLPALAQPQAPLALEGPGPFYRLQLPTAIYGLATSADLRDVRVRTATGQAVPFTWLDADHAASAAPRIESREVAVLPVPARTLTGSGTLGLKLREDGSLALAPANGSSPPAAPEAWLIDGHAIEGALIRLRVELADDAQGIFPFALDASDDLRQWQPLVENDQLVRLQRDGQSLQRQDVELGQVQARFLRLRWRDGAQPPRLAKAWLDSVPTPVPAPPALEWSGEVPPSQCGPDFCDYPAPRGLPLHAVRIHLVERNTLAAVHVSALWPASPSAAPRGHRSGLDVLRHGQPPERPTTPSNGVQVRHLADTVVYRLDQGSGEVRSAPVLLDGGTAAMLRLQTDGPVSALGTRPPTLSYAARPRVLEFLAQGQPPFALSWQASGGDTAADGASTAAMKALRVSLATQPSGRATVALPQAPAAAAPVATPVPTATTTPAAPSSPWLWAALGTGLLILGAMAWSLMRSLKKMPGDA